ncbi:single-stranded DNA-binding protein [Microaerobacter geothermalis]|uniref:single-stranded DNA-binding protein n=1 Tax=Microaerobacter geothermalis TaxID=674972 RepID=UPI001F4431F8|nr:single-stranded DNA-binding protein [Microaerobacter geothermalis]MCF6094537.1 single-stranded DNA-binding protein [Microaerobacter geothermalis]
MNNVTLVGRFVKDPELRYTQSGTAVTQVNLAVNRPFAKEGQQDVDFIPIVIWGKIAEATAQYTKKGTLVSVQGWIQVRKYQDQQGNDRWATEVVANQVEFLSQPKNGNQSGKKQESDPFAGTGDVMDISDDDLPF